MYAPQYLKDLVERDEPPRIIAVAVDAKTANEWFSYATGTQSDQDWVYYDEERQTPDAMDPILTIVRPGTPLYGARADVIMASPSLLDSWHEWTSRELLPRLTDDGYFIVITRG